MRISDWSSDVCSSDLQGGYRRPLDCRVTSLLAMTIVVLDALDDDRRRHVARGAHGDEAIATARTFEFIERGSDQDRPGGADRVAQRHRAAGDRKSVV